MFRTLSLLAFLLLICTTAQSQQPPVRIHLDEQAPTTPIPPNFLGLSFETLTLLPIDDGTPAYFTPDNHALIQLFHTLGIHSLRIGGNTADTPSIPIPTESQIAPLFQFAILTDAKVIYTLRLRESSIPQVVEAAKDLMDRYAAHIDCLAIGNEPNIYEKEFPKYASDLHAYSSAVLAAASNVRFCGPGTNISGTAPWANGYIAEFGKSPQLLWLTQHSYPGGAGGKVTDPQAGIALMLSSTFEQRYLNYYQSFVPAAQAANVHYRIEETNSFYTGGAKDVSNTFASSLWALDFLYFWLSHGSSGVNFHTGDTVAAADHQTPCWYATFWTHRDGDLDIHPIAYAMKAFDLAAHGSLLTPKIDGAPDTLKIYATRDTTETIYVTIINKQIDPNQPPVTISPSLPNDYRRVSALTLTAPSLSSTTTVTLGGTSITKEGEWRGTWQPVPSSGQSLQVKVPSGSAILLKIEK
jgi:Glycosyl hydrolase family 79 C-terminal beta domain